MKEVTLNKAIELKKEIIRLEKRIENIEDNSIHVELTIRERRGGSIFESFDWKEEDNSGDSYTGVDNHLADQVINVILEDYRAEFIKLKEEFDALK